MTTGFLVLDLTGGVVPQLTQAALLAMLADIRLGLDRDFLPEYGRLSVPIDLGTVEDVSRGHTTRIVQRCSDPGAVAFHTRDAAGRPVLEIGALTAVEQGGDPLAAISTAMDHEFKEAILNPYVNLAVQLADGRWQMRECVDPVQGDSYRVRDTVLSAFVTRAYWDPDASGPYAIGSTLPGPLTIAPHGYRAFADGSAEFGALVPAHKQAAILTHGRIASALARAA